MSKQIDALLRRAVEAGEVPGVVALAATADGPVYEAAFGSRTVGGGAAMTLDTVFRIASMTKAITCVAAMQQVEAGKLNLDGTLPDIDPALNAPQVLEGFDASGAPKLRPARRAITLRHLMTHTAGFTYEMWNPDTARYVQATETPMLMSGRVAALRRPLNFDPGERWEYGINIDWIGPWWRPSAAGRSMSICKSTSLPRSAWSIPASYRRRSSARVRRRYISARPTAA
jgi:methyl acetate hydrolase